MKNSIFLKNIEIIMIACILEIDEVPGFDISVGEYEARELKQVLFGLIKKHYVSIEGENYVVCEELKAFFNTIKSSKAYGIFNNDSYLFLQSEGILFMSVNHNTDDGYSFAQYTWGELADRWKEEFGDRLNPPMVSDDTVKKAYEIGMNSESEESSKDIPFRLALFRNPETKEGIEFLGINVGIYHFILEKNYEEAQIEEFSVDKILSDAYKYAKETE